MSSFTPRPTPASRPSAPGAAAVAHVSHRRDFTLRRLRHLTIGTAAAGIGAAGIIAAVAAAGTPPRTTLDGQSAAGIPPGSTGTAPTTPGQRQRNEAGRQLQPDQGGFVPPFGQPGSGAGRAPPATGGS
jgi:hypothetical protein